MIYSEYNQYLKQNNVFSDNISEISGTHSSAIKNNLSYKVTSHILVDKRTINIVEEPTASILTV